MSALLYVTHWHRNRYPWVIGRVLEGAYHWATILSHLPRLQVVEPGDWVALRQAVGASKWVTALFQMLTRSGQLPKVYTQPEEVQSEFDALKDHLEKFVQQSAPPTRAQAHKRTPSRHIAQLTQAAQRALRRDVPGLTRHRARVPGKGEKIEKTGWDELAPYTAKGSWRQDGLERGTQDVDDMMAIEGEEAATLDKRWASSRQPPILSR